MFFLQIKAQALIPALTIIFIAFGLHGCATQGGTPDNANITTDPYLVFSSAQTRLNCGLSCAGSYGAARRKIKSLHDSGQWKELALEVSYIGFDIDQGYYYLGRAAEELGFSQAARTYYNFSLNRPHKCAGSFNNCDGLIFPRDAHARINLMNEKVAKEAADKAAQENAARAQRDAAERARRDAAQRAAAADAAAQANKERSRKEAAEKAASDAAKRRSTETSTRSVPQAEKSGITKSVDPTETSSGSSEQKKPPSRVRNALEL
jgi:hypothetical protein